MKELLHTNDNLVEFRKYLGYTQEEFAAHLGYQTVTISKIEQGKRKISRSVIDSLAAFLQIPIPSDQYDAFVLQARQGGPLVSYAPPVQGVQKSVLIRGAEDLELIEEHLVDRFVGRDQQLTELEAQIRDGKRILLVGFPGIGKTSLAAELVARRARAGCGPVLWVEVGRESGKALLIAIARPIDSKNAAAMAGEENLGETVRDLVRQAGLRLIVLENVWSTDLSAPLKAIPPGIAVLVTSRRRVLLSAGIMPIQVRRLGIKSALRLLSHHAQRDLTCSQEARALCTELAGHPLALKLAGGLLSQQQFSPAELLDSFKDRLHAVPSLYLDDPRTISALIQESLDELQNPETHQVFAAFGALFAPRAPAPLIARLLRCDSSLIKRALLELEIINLVRPVGSDGSVVYTMHDLAYSFAKEIIEADERQQAINTCVDYAVECGSAHDLAAVHAARDNLFGAANAAIQTGEEDRLVKLIGALVTSGYFDAHGYPTVALLPLEKAAVLAENNGHTEQAHYMWAKLGNACANFLGDLVGGMVAYTRSLDTAPSPARAAILNSLLGTVSFRQGKETEAKRYFDRAEHIASQHDDGFGLSIVFEHRGTMAALFNKDYGFAQECFQKSLEMAYTIENLQARVPRMFFAFINLCGVKHDLGKVQADTSCFVQAFDFAEKALDFAQEMGSDVLMAYAFNEKGRQELALDHRADAEKSLSQALRLFAKTGDRVRENALLKFAGNEDLILKG